MDNSETEDLVDVEDCSQIPVTEDLMTVIDMPQSSDLLEPNINVEENSW